MDKINVLPDDLLVKILSLLPTNVAVSTSILSKRWKFLWMWLPKLDYTTSDPKPGLEDFINKNLPLHRAPVIESLRLDFSDLDVRPEEIRLWIEIAVSRHVHELECSYFWSYKTIFPSSLFTCNSLVTLNLRDMFLADVPSMACLPSLKTLQLKGVTFVDEGFVQKLLSICPVLEDLSVFFYDGCEYINMKKFTITVPSLQSLSLLIPEDWCLDGYVIDTPSLKYFKLVDWNDMYHYSSIKNMPKLKEAYVEVEFRLLKSVIESITSVKHLTICSEGVYGDGFVFKQLEHLSLCVCKDNSSNLLAQLLKDFPNLRVLNISLLENHRSKELDGMVCWIQPSPVPECLLSSLQIFNWSQYFGRRQDKDILVYILKNARYLKTTTVLPDTEEDYVSIL